MHGTMLAGGSDKNKFDNPAVRTVMLEGTKRHQVMENKQITNLQGLTQSRQ